MNVALIITDYTPHHQPGISELLDGIQAEYAQTIYSRHAPKVVMPVRLWVAQDGEAVVATVGVAMLGSGNALLKSMMVAREYRGKEQGLSARLLGVAMAYAVGEGAVRMYLGTMSQFVAAQHFYRKRGFREIAAGDMPADAVLNPVDDVFFMREL